MKLERRWAFGVVAGLLVLPAAAFANVYPTNLSQSASSLDTSLAQTINLGYLLNQTADAGVTVDVLNSSNAIVKTFSLGSQGVGTHSLIWDGTDMTNTPVAPGNYSFRVTASATGFGSWTLISSDTTDNNFELPRGVAVNTNPNSPYYGRVYVSNPRTNSTGAGRAMSDGVYMMNADMTAVAGPNTGGVDWTTDGSGGAGPFRLAVGPDDSVWITDWSDTHSGLWKADPNISSATEALDSTGRDANGLNSVHGSISDVVVFGTGASETVYYTDEDFPSNVAQIGSIWSQNTGAGLPVTGAPTLFYDDSVLDLMINSFQSLARSSDGTWWLSQNRSSGTDAPSLIQISADGTTVLFNSLVDLGNPDPLRTIQGIAYDPVNDWLALVTGRTDSPNRATVFIFDDDTKTIVDQFTFNPGGTSGSTNTDVSFDAVGNVYVGNRSSERVRVWSPGTGANSSFTNSLAPLGAIQVVPEPGSLMALGAGVVSLAGLIRRKRA